MLLSMQDIGVSFAGNTILEHITASVQEDSRIGLIGANGAGKSTLLNMITGALEKARRLRTASTPSISGIMMSMMIMS